MKRRNILWMLWPRPSHAAAEVSFEIRYYLDAEILFTRIADADGYVPNLLILKGRDDFPPGATRFTGWYTEAEWGQGALFDFAQPLVRDEVVYARFDDQSILPYG